MFKASKHDFLVPTDGSFRVKKAPTGPDKVPGKKKLERMLADKIDELHNLQRVLYASDTHSLLVVFQAMDAAGKDGTIRAVLSGVNPAGCQVYSFKQPSDEELDHDFLWRTARCLPERGRIGIFNRSYYEEVLVVRVHPEYLANQRLPHVPKKLDELWAQRYESIIEHEQHLARNGTVVVKFWLNVSRDEQKARFLKRIDDPDRNWKFSMADVKERQYWNDYMGAYEDLLNATSKPWAPWYAIPADNKAYMRLKVAEVLVETLKSLDLKYPVLDDEAASKLNAAREALVSEDDAKKSKKAEKSEKSEKSEK